MKPVSLCLIQMGQKGLELVRAYPDVLSKEELSNIVLKSMPLGAKDGDFTTSTVGESVISGYIFGLPGENRKNIASLTAIFSSMDFQPLVIKKIFSFIVEELRKNSIINVELISNILPKMYTGFTEGYFKIKVSSVVTLEFEVPKSEGKKKSAFQEFGDDIWK